MQSLSIAATGMMAQQLNVEVISNNIANMSTSGFKRQRAEFQDLLYQNLGRPGAASSDAGTIVPSGVQVGLGVKTGSVYRITSQGNLNNTEAPLDMAVQGRGYFRVELPNGETAYTRAGNFSRDPNGQIVTSDGYLVQPGIAIPEDARDISINAQGQVQVSIDGQNEPVNVGQIELATFANAPGLEPMGDNYFRETAASGAPNIGAPGDEGVGTVLQRFLETSNVNAVSEISSLINAQRAYEMNSKVITASDEMMSVASNLR